jgi:hypothetical protein
LEDQPPQIKLLRDTRDPRLLRILLENHDQLKIMFREYAELTGAQPPTIEDSSARHSRSCPTGLRRRLASVQSQTARVPARRRPSIGRNSPAAGARSFLTLRPDRPLGICPLGMMAALAREQEPALDRQGFAGASAVRAVLRLGGRPQVFEKESEDLYLVTRWIEG